MQGEKRIKLAKARKEEAEKALTAAENDLHLCRERYESKIMAVDGIIELEKLLDQKKLVVASLTPEMEMLTKVREARKATKCEAHRKAIADAKDVLGMSFQRDHASAVEALANAKVELEKEQARANDALKHAEEEHAEATEKKAEVLRLMEEAAQLAAQYKLDEAKTGVDEATAAIFEYNIKGHKELLTDAKREYRKNRKKGAREYDAFKDAEHKLSEEGLAESEPYIAWQVLPTPIVPPALANWLSKLTLLPVQIWHHALFPTHIGCCRCNGKRCRGCLGAIQGVGRG